MSDPICGNCNQARRFHLTDRGRSELFCFNHTTGDIFTDRPSDEKIFDMACNEDEGLYERMLAKWRKENGVADLANYRAKARWTDPSIPDEEIEGVRFEWDKERKEFVKAD